MSVGPAFFNAKVMTRDDHIQVRLKHRSTPRLDMVPKIQNSTKKAVQLDVSNKLEQNL